MLTFNSHWLHRTCIRRLDLQGAKGKRNDWGNSGRETSETGPYRPFGLTCCFRLFASILAMGWDEVSMVGFSRHLLLRRLRDIYRRVCGPPDLDERSVSSQGKTFEWVTLTL